ATPFLEGYWLVATDGGLFLFGSAGFFGSTGNITLNKPIVGMASTPPGFGYWLGAPDGGILVFGDVLVFGSIGTINLTNPIVGIDGGIFTFGDAVFRGSTGDIKLNKPMLGMAVRPAFAVKVDAFPSDATESSSWISNAGDYQLVLTKTTAGGTPAGARVYGVE